jgi:hypothetical protein
MGQPSDFDFLFQRLEFRVAGDEFGFLLLRQRGGEGIGQADFEARLEIGGGVGQPAAGGMKINRQPLKDLRGFRPCFRTVLFHDGVFDLGVIHVGHVERAVLPAGATSRFSIISAPGSSRK